MPDNKKENQKDYETEEIEIEIECTKRGGKRMSCKHIFVGEQIIDSFRPELINISRIESFVVNVRESSQKDQEILKQWMKSLQGFLPGISKRTKFITPYIITKDPETKIKTLWRESVK